MRYDSSIDKDTFKAKTNDIELCMLLTLLEINRASNFMERVFQEMEKRYKDRLPTAPKVEIRMKLKSIYLSLIDDMKKAIKDHEMKTTEKDFD